VNTLKHILSDIAEMVYRVSFQNFYRQHFVVIPRTKPAHLLLHLTQEVA